MDRRHLKIFFAIAEAYPFVKVGGLADVGGALPKALARRGHAVRLLLPGYPRVGVGKRIVSLEIPLGPVAEVVHVYHHGTHHGVDVYTVGNERLFAGDLIYGYEDHNVVPFALFSKAVVAFAARAEWRPDVIHCNDWHLGLAPHYARYGSHRAALERTGIVFTIHNLAYQGALDPETEPLTGLEDGHAANLLALGIAYADKVNTVSQRYLQEILTPEHGLGLDGLLRSRRGDLCGILNGVDYEEFNPATDPYIAMRYDGSVALGKQRNKRVLQQRSGLTLNPDAPLLGMVARLVDQKGVDLLCGCLDDIVALGAQVVVMGVGEDQYRHALEDAAARHAGTCAFHATAQEALARLVYAGSDFLLAPSAYEPCGLSPLIALRYGSIPIVRRTGGLAQTIRDYTQDPNTGLGFAFTRKYPGDFLKTVQRALEVYRQPDHFQTLQRRAMAADFSWETSSRAYEHLYRQAMTKCQAVVTATATARPAEALRRPKTRPAVPLALTHHANQYLITDGYDNRQGIAAIVEGYAAVLRLHEKYGVPANLHLSATLLETLAWHCPWFLALVRELRAKELLALIGGTYAENVMPLFPSAFNVRQLNESFWLYRQHLHCRPTEVTVCWVPERVWDTATLAPVLTGGALANGGYRYVLLDDRLLYPTNGSYPESPRARFDATNPYSPLDAAYAAHRAEVARGRRRTAPYRPYRIAAANGLVVVPMAANLRYWVPPASSQHWQHLEETVASLAQDGRDDTLLVYADDLERTAGVGGWDARALERYDAFLRWVASRQDLAPILLPEWLESHAPREERALEPGTYFELAHDCQAGEDYRGWWESATWAPYRCYLVAAQEVVRTAEREGVDPSLLALAWKHLLASTYETAWHDPAADGKGRAPAPWARALASHARACLVMVAAGRWFAQDERRPSVEVVDVDDDGEEEVLLRNRHLFAVLTPRQGGRLVYLFALTTQGGVLVIGNPTDDWNFQEDLNRYMEQPPNHPGALADVGGEHDRYRVSVLGADTAHAFVEMTNVQDGSRLYGTRKSLLLAAHASALVVCYHLPHGVDDLATEACLSPDYYRLLREGRDDLHPCQGDVWRGFRTGDVAVWLGRAGDEDVGWEEPAQAEAGHGLNVRLRAHTGHVHLLIGYGETDDERCRRLIAEGRRVMHEVATPAGTRGRTSCMEGHR